MNKYEFYEQVVHAIRWHFEARGATERWCPVITAGTGACENVPTAFLVEKRGEPFFLSQTTQPELELAVLRDGMKKVYTVGRSYRHEPKEGDGRHLSEFLLIEYEELGMDLTRLIMLEKDMLHHVIETVLDEPSAIDQRQQNALRGIYERNWPTITYTGLVDMLQARGVSIQWGDDLSSRDEEMVCAMNGGLPVFVTHYPESLKFWNMSRTDREPLQKGMPIAEYNAKRLTVECCDLLLPNAGETIGSSERETNVETLRIKLVESTMFAQMVDLLNIWQMNNGKQFDAKQRTLAAFEPYLAAFEGHEEEDIVRSGFGLGVGRLLQFLLGATKVVEI